MVPVLPFPEWLAGGSSADLRMVLASLAVFAASADGEWQYLSARARELTGMSVEVPGSSWLDCTAPAERNRLRASWQQAVSGGQPWTAVVHWTGKTPATCTRLRAHPIPRAQGGVAGYLGAVEAIADIQAEQRRDRFLAIALDPICALDLSSPYLKRVNPAFAQTLGYTQVEMLGRPWLDFVHPEDRERSLQRQAALRIGAPSARFESRWRHHNGSYRWLAWHAYPAPEEGLIYTFGRDITAQREAEAGRRQAEAALRQSEKLAAMGRVAASIAHEINNPLAASLNFLYLLRQDPGLSARSQEYLRQARDALDRVAVIARDTLGYYREPAPMEPVAVGEVLRGVLGAFFPRARMQQVAVSRRLEDQGLRVRGSANELRQVFLNLLGNAVDAMPQGGRLSVHLYRAGSWDCAQQPGLHLSLADSGPGLPPGSRARVFEPFFTTKGPTGTGLGLWISREIIRKHGGELWARNRLGASGACFHLFLPAADVAAA